MFNLIFEYYRLNNYDTRPGAGITLHPNKTLGLTSGDERPLYVNSKDFVLDDDDDLDDIDLDNDTLDAVFKKLHQPVYSIDKKRSDPGHTSGNMRQTGALNEKHTNPITKGISPYRQRKFDGPPVGGGGSGQAFRTTGNFRYIGTQYGTSRAPIDYDSENYLYFDSEPEDPMERSFLKHQRKIKKIKDNIKRLNKKKKKLKFK